jgi:hypothetical protein
MDSNYNVHLKMNSISRKNKYIRFNDVMYHLYVKLYFSLEKHLFSIFNIT